MANNIGKITQIIGAVLDIKFTEGNLPEINDAIRIPLRGDQPGFAKRHSQWNLKGFAQAFAVSMMVDVRVGNDQPRRGQPGVFQRADQLVIFL